MRADSMAHLPLVKPIVLRHGLERWLVWATGDSDRAQKHGARESPGTMISRVEGTRLLVDSECRMTGSRPEVTLDPAAASTYRENE